MLISINRNLINKATPELIAKYNGTFENVNISAIDLANSVNEGFAFCSQHKEQRRKSSNFTGAGFLAIDIDHGLTLETVQADTYYKKYGTIIYTTPSHTADAHRFRIVFELETPILDAQKMTQALTGLISRFGADGSCKDACRLFFGSKNSAPIVSDNRLPTSEVDALVLRAQESYVRSDSVGDAAQGAPSPIRSRMNIAKDSTVRTAQGHEKQLRDLPPKTRIYCSQHIDSRPSAVTLRSRKDNPGFFCSTCNATFFLDDGFGSNNYVDEYSFDYNWHKLLEISPREREMYTDETGWIDISDVRGGNIREIDEQYLPFDETTFAGIPVKPSSEMNPMLRDVFDFDEVPATYNVTYVRSPKCVFR